MTNHQIVISLFIKDIKNGEVGVGWLEEVSRLPP
jgi:hypothetical protein